jgi:uncharacterized protein with PIN domain
MVRVREYDAQNLIEAMKRDLALIVVCFTCERKVVFEPETIAKKKGPYLSIKKFREKLKCTRCGSRHVDVGLFSKWEVMKLSGAGPR